MFIALPFVLFSKLRRSEISRLKQRMSLLQSLSCEVTQSYKHHAPMELKPQLNSKTRSYD